MSIKLKKILRTVCKVVLLLVGVGIVGYVGYMTYMSVTYKPRDVRVSNITDSSFTVSWVTDSPMRGVVYYKDNDSFLPGPLAWVGSSKAVDDRDFALAQSKCVEEFNREASVTATEDFTVSTDNFDCEDISVREYGDYYTHHVTLKNLDSERDYYFRVGDTFFYWEGEFSSAQTFSQLEEVKEPTPIFGRITNEEGVYTDDSIIYATFENGREGKDSILYSSATNEDGGWYLDGSYIRTEEGELVGMESGQDLFKANAQYMNYDLSDTHEWLFGYFGGNYPNIVVDYSGVALEIDNPESGQVGVLGVGEVLEDGEVLGSCNCSISKEEAASMGWGNAYRACANQCSGVVDETVLAHFGHANNSTAIAGNLNAVTGSGTLIAASVERVGDKAYIDPTTGRATSGSISPTNGGGGREEGEEDGGIPPVEYREGYSIEVDTETGAARVGNIAVEMRDYIPDIVNSCSGATGANCKVCIGKGSGLEGCHVVVDPVDIKFTEFVAYLTSQVEAELSKDELETSALTEYRTHLLKLEPLADEYLGNTSTGQVFEYNGQEHALERKGNGDFYFTIDGEERFLSDIIGNCLTGALACNGNQVQVLQDIDIFRDNIKKVTEFAILSDERIQDILMENHGYENGICILPQGCPCQVQGISVVEGESLSDCFFDSGMGDDTIPGTDGLLEIPTDGVSSCGFQHCICSYEFTEDSSQNYEEIVSNGEPCPQRRPLVQRDVDGRIVLNPLDDGVETTVVAYKGGSAEGVECSEPECACGNGVISRGYVCTSQMARTLSNGDITTIRNESRLCTDPDGCKCRGSNSITFRWNLNNRLRENISFGDYCFAGLSASEYKQDRKSNEVGEVNYRQYCEHPNGCICGGTYEVKETELCVRPSTESSILGEQNDLRMLSNLLENLLGSTLRVNQAFANTENDYMYFLPEYGFYDMEVEGLAEIENVPALERGEYRLFYVEANGIDGFQMPKDPDNPRPGEDILLRSNALRIRYKTTASSQILELKRGINIVSFDYIPKINKEGPTKASDLLEYLQGRGHTVGFMSYFEGGRWKGVLVDQDGISGTDFSLLPGRGYLIRSLSDISIQVPVYEIQTSVPISLSAGWNLIGLHGYRRAYTAGSLIDSINLIQGLTADNVSWWPVSKGRYEGLQITDGTEYGFDFPITTTNGYFVRINEFEPEDQACRSIIWNDRGDLHGTCGHSKSIF